MEILILRDESESARKCSLTPIRGSAGVRFVSWRPNLVLEVGRCILLDPEGSDLEPADRGLDLLLLDSSWRKLPRLRRAVRGDLRPRRLPSLVTAYPRRRLRSSGGGSPWMILLPALSGASMSVTRRLPITRAISSGLTRLTAPGRFRTPCTRS
jgi:hypothetical protein